VHNMMYTPFTKKKRSSAHSLSLNRLGALGHLGPGV